MVIKMENKEVVEKNFYKTERKELFLKESTNNHTISEITSKSYARIFWKTFVQEEALKKDLCQFSLEEIETILFSFKANNRNTVESYGRIISSYLNWCLQKGYTNKNVMGNLKPTDFERYMANEETYFTEKQLRRYEDRCVNAQDAVIIDLLFLGVGGRQLSEIRNLKREHISWDTNEIKLINTLKSDKEGRPVKFTERTVHVEDYTLNLIKSAIDTKTYTKRNGDMEPHLKVRPFTDLVENNYIVRTSITKTDNWDNPVDKFVIYRRIDSISKSLGIEELTTKYIQRSGMIYEAYKLLDNEGNLSLDDLKIVADTFNMKSYHNLKGFLTVENIRKTYPKIEED